jgi:hypothetical protein
MIENLSDAFSGCLIGTFLFLSIGLVIVYIKGKRKECQHEWKVTIKEMRWQKDRIQVFCECEKCKLYHSCFTDIKNIIFDYNK